MDTKRLSLNNLHDSIRSTGWPTIKLVRRQIVKCINECKTQANNAKKLVDNIKEHSKPKGTDRTEDEEDDDIGWGSDFDDDSDENDDSVEIAINEKSKTSLFEYSLKQNNSEDLLYEPVSDYMSDGSFRALDTELQSTKTDANTLLSHTHEPIGHVLNNTNNISKIVESLNISLDNKLINTNGFGSGGVGGGESSPKPSPRLMPKPPNTKPEVPKNKPQILPRKPIMNNVVKTAPNSQLKRPPSEPPPPPLPKSPPPVSAFGIPSDLNSLLSESSSYSSNSQNQSEENYEQIILPLTEDEYLSPISIETPVIMDENKCFAPKAQFSSSQSLNQCLSEDYEPFREMSKSVEQIHQMCISEENYEEVKEFNEINDNHLNYKRSVSQRPLLPKVKETSIVNKSKLISDVFPNIPNWNRNSKDKKSGKERQERQESDTNSDENSLKSHSLEFINHNNSLGICTRPLPPLPSPPMHPLSHNQSNTTFASNESLRDYEWFHIVEREDAEALLLTQEEDGAYLVRESKRAGKSNPYTLTIFHNGRVFHLNIRKRPDGLFALGKEKTREKTFKTVSDLVSYHTSEPILLTTRGTPAGKTRLITTPSSSALY